jgi:hypothetical protein
MDTPNFTIKNTLATAWQYMRGAKWPVWIVLLVTAVGVLGTYYLTAASLNLIGLPHNQAMMTTVSITIHIITTFIAAGLITGALMIALKKIRGDTISSLSGFQYWNKWWKIGISVLLLNLGVLLINLIFGFLFALSQHAGAPKVAYAFFLLRFLATILFFLFFIFNTLSLADKNLGPIASLGYSATIVRPHWLKLLGMWGMMTLIIIATLLPKYLSEFSHLNVIQSLGLLATSLLAVWTIPYLLFITSNAYHQLSKP